MKIVFQGKLIPGELKTEIVLNFNQYMEYSKKTFSIFKKKRKEKKKIQGRCRKRCRRILIWLLQRNYIFYCLSLMISNRLYSQKNRIH